MVSFDFGLVGLDGIVESHGGELKRFVENNDKIVLEIFGNAPRIPGGISDDFILFGYDFYIRALVESVDDNIRILLLGKDRSVTVISVVTSWSAKYTL